MSVPEKVLFIAWQSPQNRAIFPVARLVEREEEPRYEFAYIKEAVEAGKHGFEPFLGFPDLDRLYRGDELFPLFSNRLMPASRPEYARYLSRLRLDPESAGPMAILTRSSGRRTTDKLEIFSPPVLDPETGSYIYHFLARGVRYMPHAEERIRSLKPGDRLYWMLDRQNPVETDAVALRTKDYHIVGFLPRYLLDDISQLVNDQGDLQICVARVNLDEPIHHRLLCRLAANWTNGFVPFSSEAYQPLSPDATPVDLRPIKSEPTTKDDRRVLELDILFWAIPKQEAWLVTRVEGWVRADPAPPGDDSPPLDYDENREWHGYVTADDKENDRRAPVPRYSRDDAAWARIESAIDERGLREAFDRAISELPGLGYDSPEKELRVKAAVRCWPKD